MTTKVVPKPTGNLILVKWRDITSWSGWNEDIVSEGKDEPMVFYTVGFLTEDED